MVQLTKHHALGNDFLICLPLPGEDTPARRGDAGVARSLCDRRRGVGADGLIWASRLQGDAGAPRWQMLLLNADGSEAEISGNGVRCLGQAIWRSESERERVTASESGDEDRNELLVRTGGGVRCLRRLGRVSTNADDISVDMGPVSEGPGLDDVTQLLSVVAPRHLASARIGNPHIVAHVDDASPVALAEIGPLVEAAVPGGINLHLLEVLDDHTIALRHWERGAGLTDACGSGASVSAHLAHRWGLTGPTVEVRMPGGDATVGVGATVELRSPVTYVATVEVP